VGLVSHPEPGADIDDSGPNRKNPRIRKNGIEGDRVAIAGVVGIR
jgi:hypothetical protein